MKKLKNKTLKIFTIFLVLITTPPETPLTKGLLIAEENDPVIINLSALITDIDTTNMVVHAIIQIDIQNYPVDAEAVYVKLNDFGYTEIECERLHENTYWALVPNTIWYLDGLGDMFPYDHYEIPISIYEPSFFYKENGEKKFYYRYNNTQYFTGQIEYQLQEYSFISFSGTKSRQLMDTWITADNSNTIHYLLEEQKVIGIIERQTGPLYAQFIMPLYLALGLMLFTVITSFEPKTEMLTIYGFFIAFSPLSILSIQSFLPHRRTLCIPEFYSVIVFIASLLFMFKYLFNTLIIKLHNGNRNQDLFFIVDLIVIVILFFIHRYLINAIYEPIINFPITNKALTVFSDTSNLIIFSTVGKIVIYISYKYFNVDHNQIIQSIKTHYDSYIKDKFRSSTK